ncbi:hypothetical protein AAFF_G00435910 [Aldrovandia affinis]|uniref:Uncharacterized protein n=1 Tax=Aldrovandia affinis TaxID=143900 RepID=A0AAD7S7V7_9TELE|nr:hypothetical protein AAFF_G00435910 [Aldrovandia affinis]
MDLHIWNYEIFSHPRDNGRGRGLSASAHQMERAERTAEDTGWKFSARVIEWKLIWPSLQSPGLLVLDAT